MKKLILTLISAITLLNFAYAQTDNWVNYKIDEKLSVKLPTQPETINRGVMAHTPDSLVCLAYKLAEVDSATLTRAVSSPGFPDGLKAAMSASQPGLNLGEMKAGKWHGYTCYNVDGAKPAMGLKVGLLILIVDGRIYTLGAMMPDRHDINEKNIFFNTLKLN